MASVLEQVQEGARVVDSNGDEVGNVEFVHLSDEDPSTPGPEVTVSEPVRHDGLPFEGALTDMFRTDDVPEPLRHRLMRQGFIRVDAKGLFAADRYVMAEQIASASGDRVTLKVTRDELIKQP